MTAMYQTQDNPVLNLTANLAGIAASVAFVGGAAIAATIGHMFATLLPAILWLLRTLISDSGKMDKPIKVALVLCVVGGAAMLAPAVTGCVVLLVAFAVVSKPK